jgi:diguanylate cyclase (GGDEF)-like protein
MAEDGAVARVLVVAPASDARAVACRALADLGIEPLQAGGREEALGSIGRAPPDLVLLDLEIPGADGLALCAEIRTLEAGRDVPILVATEHTDVTSIDRAFEAGATDFVSKPLDPQLFQHRARFLMRASQAFGDLRRTLTNLRLSQERLANAQRLAQVGNWEWVPGEEEMLWSDEMYRLLGTAMRVGAATYAAFLAAVHADDRAEVEKAMLDVVQERRSWSLDHRLLLPSGMERVVHHQAELVAPDGQPERVVGTLQDITDRRRAEEQIRYLAYYDSLTGLPNRRMLQEHMGRVIEASRRRERLVGLLFVDLDRFKRINDTLGHAMGDRLLKAVAGRLLTSVRATDYVGRPQESRGVAVSRLGGDEFTVVLSHLRSPDEAAQVARRVLEVLRAPFSFQGQSFVISASIGIAMYPGDGDDVDTLLRNADAAMYHAKSAGRDGFRFFRESMNRAAVRSLRLEGALRRAIEREELLLEYQPLVETATGALTGVEALVRWRSEEFGLVTPEEFIPLAEDTGLIESLGEWVLRSAFTQQRAWLDAGLEPGRLAVNVSSRQLVRPELVRRVRALLEECSLEPDAIELEITEGVLMDDEPAVLEALHSLKELGVRLALDDFGTGYSSLSRLFRFPIDILKIDQTFVREIGTDSKPDAIIAAVVAMARRLRLVVTAEGVETEHQRSFLCSEGCDRLQGYLIAPPLEAGPAGELIRGWGSGPAGPRAR